jgi:hypothetical protein
MSEERLPKNYKGYSTQELLDLWESIPGRTIYDPRVSKKKMSAMDDLLREYKIMDSSPGDYAAKIRRSKRLLAPFGIDPYPMCDAEGISREDLSLAHAERCRQQSKEVRERYALQAKEMGRWAYLDRPEPED